MKREDLHMDNSCDQVINSKPYFTAAQLLDLKKEKTLVIQCYWRGYVARQRSWGIRQRLHELQLAEQHAAEVEAAQEARHKKYEVERRVNPRTRKDFELLYNELEAWREQEVARISAIDEATIEQKHRAMCEILAQETKALQTIDRLKCKAAKEGRSKRVGRVMDMMAEPKRWEVGDGELQEVHTPFTTRAAELRDLYLGLTTPSPTLDDRLQMLLNVKWTVSCRVSPRASSQTMLVRVRTGSGICVPPDARYRRAVRSRS